MDVFYPAPFITLGRDPWREFLDLVERAKRCREALDAVVTRARCADERGRLFRRRPPAGAGHRQPACRLGEAGAVRSFGRVRGPPRAM